MSDRATDEKLADILQPNPQAKEFRITMVFGHKMSANYKKAVDLARRNPDYKEEGAGEFIRHYATFGPDQVDDLFALFPLVHDWETTEILVNNRPLPYGHQLWTLLMWFYRIKQV